MLRTLSLFLCALAVGAMAVNASAVTKTWNVGTGNWNVSGNWTPTGIPVSADEIKISNTSGKCTVPASYTANCYRVYIYNAGNDSLTVASGGTLNCLTGFLKVGFGSTASTQDGTVIQAGNVTLSTTAGDLILGDGYTSSYTTIDGWYRLNSGTLVCDQIMMGERKGFGHMIQAGGSINAAATTMAYDSLAQAEYRMTGGSLVTGTLQISKGTFDQAKGAFVDVNGAMAISGTGVYEMEIQSTSDFSKIRDISGNVTLTSGCRLNIVPVGGYTPAVGNEMMVLSSTGTITGTFTNVPSGWVTELRNSNHELWLRCTAGAPVVAFPGAEGEGKFSLGGRGGDVYHVTNLNSSGAGSLAYGIDYMSGPRTIVFDTSGTITLTGKLRCDTPFLTIAGQTAPDPGILIRNFGVALMEHDQIIRHVRIRPGDAAKGISPNFFDFSLAVCGADSIADHVSTSWSISQCITVDGENFDDVTVQYCIAGEGLDQSGIYHNEWNSTYNPGGTGHHAMGIFVKPVTGGTGATYSATVHHNIMVDEHNRNPCIGTRDVGQAANFDARNNVIYNCRYSGYNSGESDYINMNYVSNYLIAGPNTTGGWESTAFDSSAEGDVRIYQTGNMKDPDKDTSHDGVSMTSSSFIGTFSTLGSAVSMEPVTTETAANAYTNVMAHAGAFWWTRDSVDTRLIGHITNRNGGLINSQSSVGGYPTITVNVRDASFDTDGDGMANTWESANGTNPSVADNNGDVDGDGYTNLEEYINSLVH